MVEVVNKYRGGVGVGCSGSVYIGRGSVFGNPFRIGPDGSQPEVIEKYRAWFLERIGDPSFRREVWELEGKALVCFCSPLACMLRICANHGDVLKWWLEMGEEGEGAE